MFATLLILSGLLTYFLIAKPLHVAVARSEERRFRETYYLFKLREVRRHYPELQRLSHEEIAQRFNVTELYNRLTIS